MSQHPLISCVMATYNRRWFVPHAIKYFLRQTYEPKELLILDDGTDSISDLIPNDSHISYYYQSEKRNLGIKLNILCKMATGEIIAIYDDDDFYTPWRLSYQVEAMKDEQIQVCGINKLLYYDLLSKKAYRYAESQTTKTWLLGSSLCFKKELWEDHQFREIDVGMDKLFVWATPPEHIAVLPDNTFAVFMAHSTNISPKQTDRAGWHLYSVEEIKKIVGEDWAIYGQFPQ